MSYCPANLEDDRTGHFFEQRFYSGALLTEEALIAAMAYVDLNPVRAKLANRIEEIRDTSIGERLQVNSAEALADYLRPGSRPASTTGPRSPARRRERSSRSRRTSTAKR